ncbi:nitronate monooxygenase [Gordonia sp. NB41Y]|uniref:NAD(P)H-dependent flavin oxidoreductase n=1 Tax=Gordonia sp. NB41Y TaxID=875808 RepID=UPI0002BE3C91|nr:nitronate monooxygenase [Gordonia sp. NB41Y]EMP14187.1 2-nitropropane dioxygenase [Gordonia sp. NB41Y]WLP88789.1 nitronate monooxygenase [Gordonia sp. NB41Y]
MFELSDLEIPVVAAPMAGGPSTTALAIAVNHAGGLGFLAAGYADPGVLAGQIEEVRVAAGAPFGVNIFVPGLPVRDRVAVQEYRESLRPLADRYGIDLPDIVEVDDDGYRTKLDLVIEHRVPVVSFTFGLPSAEDVARLHDAGIFVVSTVADPDDADRAVALGVDALCVQGVEAGGHRGTLDLDAVPNTTPTVRLVREVVDRSDVPVIAAGGIGDGTAIIAALAAGASAVQLGTALLDTDEAGTKPTHRAALRDPRFTETVVTRCFSGRYAQALRNRFTDTYSPSAPAEYPALHHLTSPLRKAAAAAGDADDLNLWAGHAFRSAPTGPAAEVITTLWADARRG